MYRVDTIAAIATPPGPGGVGMIRISGPNAVEIADRVFESRRHASTWSSHRLYHGYLRAIDGRLLDEGLAVVMRAPRSYTGEDVLELHCHGSPVVLRQVLAHVLACDARVAEAGEFTKRAFVNGRLDLAQAEAVADLIAARSAGGAAMAAAQLGGSLSGVLAAIRDDLIDLKALLEAQIDFSEADVVISADELMSIVDRSSGAIQRLCDTYGHGLFVRDGFRLVIVGKPNVGKSSLLNALLGSDRAIVTDRAGTTRDTIDELADFKGIPVVLTDTAGLRHESIADSVERIGMQRTTAALRDAQISLLVIDGSQVLTEEDRAVANMVGSLPCVVVINKDDLESMVSSSEAESMSRGAPIVRVSAKELYGLDELRSTVLELVQESPPSGGNEPVVSNARHHAALVQARSALQLACESIRAARPPDLIAVDVQDALDHVGGITGVVTSEDVLDRIFSHFCIGK